MSVLESNWICRSPFERSLATKNESLVFSTFHTPPARLNFQDRIFTYTDEGVAEGIALLQQ
ncbi:hypothetical protein OGM63_07165 [Plectonema radiosum NIES-515]|uniref:Uncharacterized protein n=1 Tax=Plectonema radiosum NIES-515 TaxID=2986073 RepID=A0ABT3AW44_9CYAN|nr:hypothetical protein [Plectonema radiosum]MCV3213305.1 hypothetical protein [Plectonema radiosum NIES-515]